MHKHTVDVPGAGEFASRPRSRRDFFKTLAAAGAGAAGGSLLLSGKANAQSASASASAGGDVDLLNFALTIEYFESEVFYPAALEAGILSGESEAVVAQLADIEAQHRDALIGLIEELGGTPIERSQFVVPDHVLASEGTFLEAALAQEITDVGASLGLAPMIQSPDVLAAAGALSGVEGENVVAVRQLLGLVPYAAEAFPAALTMDEVLAAVSPFVGGLMETGGGEYRDPTSFGRV